MDVGKKKYVCPFSRCSSKSTGKRQLGSFGTKGNLKRHLNEYHKKDECHGKGNTQKTGVKRKRYTTTNTSCYNQHNTDDDIHQCPFDECRVKIKTLDEFLKHIYVNHSSAILSSVLSLEKVKELMKRTEHINFPIDYTKILPPSDHRYHCCSYSDEEEEEEEFDYEQSSDNPCGICVNCYDKGTSIHITTTTTTKKTTGEENQIEHPSLPDLGFYPCPNCHKQYNHFSCLVRHVHEKHLEQEEGQCINELEFKKQKIKDSPSTTSFSSTTTTTRTTTKTTRKSTTTTSSSHSSVNKVISDISLTFNVNAKNASDFHIMVTV